jgi:thiamine transport system substrate-binding protein
MTRTTTRLTAALGTAALLAVAGCSVSVGNEGSGAGDSTVTLLTHDSFALPDELLAEFEERSGMTLELVRSGDAGSLTNQLVLSKDEPVGDVVFGIDNTFASRAVEAGVLAEYVSAELPGSGGEHTLDGEGVELLTPVDWGDVCVNVDDAWFRDKGIRPPRTLEDLTDPTYEGLFVTPAASTSSPGFAFLLATIGEYGEDGWRDYWQRLMDNGARVVAGWTDAYEVDFTAGGGGGDRPIVLSYNSSPPFTIPEGGKRPTTSALLDTCFRQVEYAGVLEGTDNRDGAEALVDFLVSPEVQQALPDSMYVFPVDDSVDLPPLWARWAEPAPEPVEVAPDAVAENREDWLRDWSDLTS